MEKSNHYQPAVNYHTMNGWLECTSKGSGRKYYYNTSTCESTWEQPAEFLRAAKKAKTDKPRISEAELPTEHTPKKFKGEGLLLTPTSKSNGTHHLRTGPATPVVSTSLRHDNHHHHDLLRQDSKGSNNSRASSSTSRRQSLNHRSNDSEFVSLHEAIPSPVINREQKSNNSSHNSSPVHHKREMIRSDRLSVNNSVPGSSNQKLSKFLNNSLDVSAEEGPDQEDIMRTKFLDPSSISLLTNQPAEILERQSNQLHQDARRLLDVDRLRTIADCANLRAVQNVQSLRVLNIEHKLSMLRDHIKWLEEGNDFT
ncbi:hypothetical protein ACHWQZ_G018983 [Mnemiopsis leidyi]